MSDNPTTKAYAKRVKRLAARLSMCGVAVNHRPGVDVSALVDQVVSRFDPEAPKHLVTAALEQMVEGKRAGAAHDRKWADVADREADSIEGVLEAYERPRLRVVS